MVGMINMKRILISMAVFLFLFSGAVLAAPGIPNQFYGSVAYNDGPAPNGLSVVAKIDGVVIASTVTYDGTYSLIVADNENNRSGDIVRFFVDGIDTAKTGIFCNGCVTEISLSVTYSPAPATQSSSTNGGGGGAVPPRVTEDAEDVTDELSVNEVPSTVSTTTKCVERWVCSEWGECVDSIHKRICVDENNCGTEDHRPFESEPCPILKEETNEAVEEAGEGSAVTPIGFAIFETLKKPESLAVVGIILLIIFLVLYVKSSRNKQNSVKTHENVE